MEKIIKRRDTVRLGPDTNRIRSSYRAVVELDIEIAIERHFDSRAVAARQQEGLGGRAHAAPVRGRKLPVLVVASMASDSVHTGRSRFGRGRRLTGGGESAKSPPGKITPGADGESRRQCVETMHLTLSLSCTK